jgi:sulfide:quinone oxidoreductase
LSERRVLSCWSRNRHPPENVYAVGDGANTGTPKAGVFAKGAAPLPVLLSPMRGSGDIVEYNGFGTCYIEFCAGRIGKVEVDFFSGLTPTGNYYEPSVALRAEKETFGSSRRSRWFGL